MQIYKIPRRILLKIRTSDILILQGLQKINLEILYFYVQNINIDLQRIQKKKKSLNIMMIYRLISSLSSFIFPNISNIFDH